MLYICRMQLICDVNVTLVPELWHEQQDRYWHCSSSARQVYRWSRSSMLLLIYVENTTRDKMKAGKCTLRLMASICRPRKKSSNKLLAIRRSGLLSKPSPTKAKHGCTKHRMLLKHSLMSEVTCWGSALTLRWIAGYAYLEECSWYVCKALWCSKDLRTVVHSMRAKHKKVPAP